MKKTPNYLDRELHARRVVRLVIMLIHRGVRMLPRKKMDKNGAILCILRVPKYAIIINLKINNF